MVSREQPINTFSVHTRERYGAPVGKIPLEVGVRCPNRSHGGCIFCRPASFTPGYLSMGDPLSRQLARGKRAILRNGFDRYFAYFQQETCTALATAELLALIEPVLTAPDCLGLIISTRPDYVADDFLAKLSKLLAHLGKECLFEIGMQSAHDQSLALLNRNHTFADVCDTLARIRAAGPFTTGVHLLFGIPGESEADMLGSVQAAADLEVDAVKLHHLQVIEGTALHDMYGAGTMVPFTLDGYMELLIKVLALLPPDIVVHRLWATSHPDVLIAPRWNVLAGQLRTELDYRLREADIIQGRYYRRQTPGDGAGKKNG